MSAICMHCDGWGCTHCQHDRAAASGGEQGLTSTEHELAMTRRLLAEAREELATVRAELTRLEGLVQ